MIVDSHTYVGDFPMFDLSVERAGLLAGMREQEIATGFGLHPDDAMVRGQLGHGNSTCFDVADRDPNDHLQTPGLPLRS